MLRRRNSLRLSGYDYSEEGAYFITIVTHGREALFGRVVNGEMVLNPFGRIVKFEWMKSSKIRREMEIYPDEFVVMPNHIHGIIVINSNDPCCRGVRPDAPTILPHRLSSKSLGSFVCGFKSSVTKRINNIRHTPGQPVWQRNYYDHIIRDEKDNDQISEYIVCNPENWEHDDVFIESTGLV
jgi:putative transposase